jgi:hypothetical protein
MNLNYLQNLNYLNYQNYLMSQMTLNLLHFH